MYGVPAYRQCVAIVGLSILPNFAASASAADLDGWTLDRFWQQQQNKLP